MNTKPIGRSGLRINFTNKLMTAYGGFSLLGKLFDRLNLAEEVTEMIPFSELSPSSTGVFAKVLKLGLTTMAGGERFTHSAFLGNSHEIYEQTFGVKKIPRSITAVTRFFNKFKSWQKNEELADKLWGFLFSKVIPLQDIGEDYLTFDSSVVTRYGRQEGARKGYNPKKKGRPSHHPILAFLNRSKYVVNLWNRSGDCSSGNGIVDFAEQTLTRLEGTISIKGILADSGFYRVEFLEFSESKDLEYVISAPMQRNLQSEIYRLENWTDVDEGLSVCEFQFRHKDPKWAKERRYIVVRRKIDSFKGEATGKNLSLFPEEDEKAFGYRYGLYVTSSSENPVDLWRRYRLRANDENIIKENKLDFGLEGFSMKGFYATEAAMLFRVMFYNIFNFFRSQFLTGVESKQTLQTLRSKYFIIPAVLGRDGKNPILRLGIKKQNLKQKFLYILNQIDLLFDKRNAFGGEGATDDSRAGLVF